MSHVYETGRLNLPFVGIATFGKRPYVQDWGAIRADAAILGAMQVWLPAIERSGEQRKQIVEYHCKIIRRECCGAVSRGKDNFQTAMVLGASQITREEGTPDCAARRTPRCHMSWRTSKHPATIVFLSKSLSVITTAKPFEADKLIYKSGLGF